MSDKTKLEELSQLKEKELEKELIGIVERLQSNTSKVLIIGGSLALGFILYKTLFESNSSKSKKEAVAKYSNSQGTRLGNVIQLISKQLLLVLLVFAKEKLQEYINARNDPS